MHSCLTSWCPFSGNSFPFPSFLSCVTAPSLQSWLHQVHTAEISRDFATYIGCRQLQGRHLTVGIQVWIWICLLVSKLFQNYIWENPTFLTTQHHCSLGSQSASQSFQMHFELHFCDSRATFPAVQQQEWPMNVQSHLLRSCPVPLIILGYWHSSSLATVRANACSSSATAQRGAAVFISELQLLLWNTTQRWREGFGQEHV